VSRPVAEECELTEIINDRRQTEAPNNKYGLILVVSQTGVPLYHKKGD
jgi:hypothetical protein